MVSRRGGWRGLRCRSQMLTAPWPVARLSMEPRRGGWRGLGQGSPGHGAVAILHGVDDDDGDHHAKETLMKDQCSLTLEYT